MKKALNTPSTATLTKVAVNLVKQEITRIIGQPGLMLCLRISAYLQLVRPLYREYYDLVNNGEIQMETMKQYFSDEAWATLRNPEKRMLDKLIRQEVAKMLKQIDAHMSQLDDNDRELTTLSPAGKEALAVVLQELMGEEVATV